MSKKTISYINLWGIWGISFVLCGAYYMQFIKGEFPCPLCLLQRMCMLGVAFGLLLNLQYGLRTAHYAISMLSALLGAGIAVRQILLHICPAPGDLGYGTPVLGLHLYTWAFLIFVATIFIIALLLLSSRQFERSDFSAAVPLTAIKLARVTFWIMLLLSGSNFLIALLECGIGPCPDDPVKYQLLQGEWW